jgi:hypothetical protein
VSYVRWSSPGHPWDYDSDLYIYDDVHGGTTCCACTTGLDMDGDPTHPETIAHVREHIAAGDAVPDFVIPRLADPDNGGFN